MSSSAFILSVLVMVNVGMEVTGRINWIAGQDTQDDQYSDLRRIQQQMLVVEDRLTAISKRTCESGSAEVEFCPLTPEIGYYDLLKCILSPLNGEPIVQNVEIKFEEPFLTVPRAGVFTSGLTWTVGGAYRIMVQSISQAAMTVQVQADKLFAPNKVSFNFIVCDRDVTVTFPDSSDSYEDRS